MPYLVTEEVLSGWAMRLKNIFGCLHHKPWAIHDLILCEDIRLLLNEIEAPSGRVAHYAMQPHEAWETLRANGTVGGSIVLRRKFQETSVCTALETLGLEDEYRWEDGFRGEEQP